MTTAMDLSSEELLLYAAVLVLSLLVVMKLRSKRPSEKIQQALIIPGLLFMFIPLWVFFGTIDRMIAGELAWLDYLLLITPLLVFLIAIQGRKKN